MAQISNLFTTSVYTSQLARTNSRFHQDIVQDIEVLSQADIEGQRWSETNYVGGYTSYSSYSELHRMNSTFMQLEEKITKHVLRFADELDMDLRDKQIEMTDCWLNIMPAYTSHSLHIHPLSFISGTYYVSAPTGSSAIKFEDPRLSRFMAAPPKKSRPKRHNKTHVEFEPKPGRLILFESWLGHEVPASAQEGERVSVSFNYAWS